MNEDFRRIAGTNGGANTTGLAVDCEINFCLAQTDPSGNPTTGVVRHNIAPYSNNVTNGSGGADWETMNDVETMKTNTGWDPDRYLNFWVIRPGGLSLQNGGLSGLLGYAQFPNNSGLGGLNANNGAANTDGLVCAYDAMGTIAENDGTFILNSTYNLGRTMTHEAGHWVGLRHIWGDGNCSVDDFCADTPNAAQANYSCNLSLDSCAGGGNDMVQNYMDYTNDACMDTFTQDQKDRMMAVMANSPRRGVLNLSTACQAPAPYIQFSNPTGAIMEGNSCNFTDYTFPVTILKAPSAAATVTFNVSGGTATQNVDYSIVNNTVNFPTGSSASRNLTIRVYNDGVVESDETIIVNLSLNANGGDALLGSGTSMTITLTNNDNAPNPLTTVTILSEDFEDTTGWVVLDADGDTNTWGIVNGFDGLGTAPNTISGRAAFSEKRLTYLGGTGTANPVNNYLVSPQVVIPAGANAVDLSYIVGAYDNDNTRTRNAGNFSVYFTTSITNEAAILAGTLLQSNLVINEGTTQLRSHSLLALAGQTGYIVFRHNNTAANSNTGLLLDTVLLQATVATDVQTDVNNATRYAATIPTSGNVYGSDTSSSKIMTCINSSSNFNYGCTTVEVNRSTTSVGAATANFLDTAVANAMLSKTYFIDAANDTASGNYQVTFYFTEAEVANWETATGRNRSELKIIKVIDNPISVVNISNLSNYIVEEATATIGSFGPNVTFTATFTSNLKGGYGVGPATGINCGDITTTWNGTAWSNGAPSKVKAVIITGDFSSAGDLEACSLTVSNNANVVVNSGDTFIVNGNVTVNSGSTLTVENNAALRQLDDAAVNTGNVLVKRNSAPMIRLDYTAWSSPVNGQQLKAFSPNTIDTRFYEYLYTGTTTPTAYQTVDNSQNFIPGKGYIIRVANDWSPSVASAYNGQFTGVANNGIITQSVGLGYNVVGNPYASPVDADTFLANNSNVGALYFWTHTVPSSGGVYPVNNFASYTTLGGTAAAAGGATPNGTIQVGQGVYVQATSAGNVTFNNAQRVNASISTQFFRTASTATDKNRIWLNLDNATDNFNQILVGYMQGATNGFDNLIDGKVLDTSNTMLYNVLNDEEYSIQGKAMPFSDEDVVSLGLKATTAGTYTISIDHVDGLFDNQDIFIKDKITNIIHDLKESAYTFTTPEGVYNNRFEIVYKNTALSNEDFTNNNTFVVFANQGVISLSSSNETIKDVIVYDMLGRVLYQNSKVNAKMFNIISLNLATQALVVKATLENGQTVTKKVVL